MRFGGVDYLLPPGLAGRRVQLLASLGEVVAFLDREELARHSRRYVSADVLVDPAHVRALRLARDAKRRREAKDVVLPAVDLGRDDTAVGMTP